MKKNLEFYDSSKFSGLAEVICSSLLKSNPPNFLGNDARTFLLESLWPFMVYPYLLSWPPNK